MSVKVCRVDLDVSAKPIGTPEECARHGNLGLGIGLRGIIRLGVIAEIHVGVAEPITD